MKALDRALPVAIGAFAALAMAWPWPIRPLQVPGSPRMEADNHLWMLWRATKEAGAWGNWPVGDPRPLQDLVHAPMAWALVPLDPAFAYGSTFLFDVALALFAGWLLSREAGASRGGALVGMVALGTTPFLAGALVFGLSEAWPVGWYALHGALLLRTARTGSVISAVGAGLSLAAFALSGWYAALFGMIGEGVWVLWASQQHRQGRVRWGLLIGQGLLAVLLVLPALLHFLDAGDVAGLAARGIEPWRPQPDWRHAPQGGTDPLNLVLPTLDSTELARTAYLGLSTLLLAGVGLWRRRSGWAAAGVLLFGFLATGAWLTIGGRPIGGTEPLPGPGAWLTMLWPALGGLRWWYRAAAVAAVFLAPLAALGAGALARDRRWLAVALAVLVGLDQLLLSDAPWPRPTYDPRPPAALREIPGDGAVLLLPFDHGGRRWADGAQRVYQRWQPWLDRPITEHYEGRDALADDPWVAWVDQECRSGRPDRDVWGARPDAEEPSAEEAARAVDALAAQGLEAVAIVKPKAPTPTRCAAAVRRVLGEPGGEDEEVVWWGLGATAPAPPGAPSSPAGAPSP